jgi:hypothetical protein
VYADDIEVVFGSLSFILNVPYLSLIESLNI